MSNLGKVFIVVLGLLLLWGGTLYFRRAPIGQDLTEQVQATLNRPEFSGVSVYFNGREGTLSGSVASPALRQEAEKLAGEHRGVRSIDNQLEVASESKPQVAATETAVQSGQSAVQRGQTAVLKGYQLAGKFLLSGFVPDEPTRTRLIQQAGKIFGDDNVADHLSIRSGTRLAVGFIDDYTRFLDSDRVGSVGFEIENGAFTLKDSVPGEFAKFSQDENLSAAQVSVQEKSGLNDSDEDTETGDGRERLQQRLNEFFKGTVVEFDTASVALTKSSRKILVQAAELLARFPENKVEIQGHTDNIGRSDANMRLSKARADAVYEYLIKNGVAAQRLSAKGYGDTQPIADNTTEKGRRHNRRVIFQVR